MEYPSLSLKQDSIDRVFCKTASRIQGDDFRATPSPGAMRAKLHDQKQKELLSKNPVLEECDQCDYKTSKYKAMYRHKRERHTVVRQKCTDCEYSNIYPNRIRTHFKQVHMGMKRARVPGRCRREWCEDFDTANCLQLQEHSLVVCDECNLSFERSDALKFHKDKIHLGLVFNCNFCETYSTSNKYSLARHISSKHSDGKYGWKENRKPRSCPEEGCRYIDYSGQLKQHIERKHEGVVRFKCQVMNCSFGSSCRKDLTRHMKTHDSVAVDLNATKYICPSEVCNYETASRKYLLQHTKRCKHLNSASVQDSKSPSVDQKISNNDNKTVLESHSEKSLKRLCNISGCDFITYGDDESKSEEHFRNHHKDKELTEDSFILLNSAMAEAMGILQEIRDIKEETH